MAHGSRKVVITALVANSGIAAAKLAVGLATGSAAMLAEAAHSAADTTNQVFLLVSLNLSDNPADEDHPYGHGKERFFWAFLAAIFIFVAGAFFSIYHGIEKLRHGGDHPDVSWLAYLVLGGAFVFDVVVLVIAIREARRQAGGLVLFMRESTDVTLKTALYEDVAATIGVVIAAAGLAAAQVTGRAVWDGIASVLIGVVLVAVAIVLGRQTRDLLLGAAASPRIRRALRAEIVRFPEVSEVVTLLTMQLGTDSVLVTGKINIRDHMTTDDIERLLGRITDRVREVVPEVTTLFLEPHPAGAAKEPSATGG